MELLDQLLGPDGLVVGLLVAVWAFYTGKIRRESEVIERDKVIDILKHDLAATEQALDEERRARKEAVGIAVDVAETTSSWHGGAH